MKTRSGQFLILMLLVWAFFPKAASGQATGRVVINEYLTWTNNGCTVAAEFVELMNFGPGPVDIGCYILTNGNISVTIPPNTVLEPGQFYVLGGMDSIDIGCANVDSTIKVNLNWNSCNCTNAPITTPYGFLDDGSVNEKVVLLDPNLNVIDAVARALPVLPSTTITTSNFSGGCVSQTFNLDTLPITYELLGMATGRGNSFARAMDGDCQWLKDPQQSAGATNNRAGRSTDVTYAFTVVNALNCDSTEGTVSIFVKHNDYSKVFPMTYTLVIDSNKNGKIDINDSYSSGIDYSPPEIQITGLPIGYFRVTVASVSGCYLKSFDFTILPCYPTLPVKLIYFTYGGEANNQHKLEWMLTDIEHLKSIVVEKAVGNNNFIADKVMELPTNKIGSRVFNTNINSRSGYKYFRLKIIDKNGNEFFSPVVSADLAPSYTLNKYWPNPAADKLNMELQATHHTKAKYLIYNISGHIAGQGHLELKKGLNMSTIPVHSLPTGIYQIQVSDISPDQPPMSFRFVKH